MRLLRRLLGRAKDSGSEQAPREDTSSTGRRQPAADGGKADSATECNTSEETQDKLAENNNTEKDTDSSGSDEDGSAFQFGNVVTAEDDEEHDVQSAETTEGVDEPALSDEARRRLADIVVLEPTKNAELIEQWRFDNGGEVHRYLETELKEYYYRDDESFIRVTEETHELVADEVDRRPANNTTSDDTPSSQSQTTNTDGGDPKDLDLTDRDLLMELVSLTQHLGRIPTATEVNDRAAYTHQRYREEFGSLLNAYKQAGLVDEDVSKQAALQDFEHESGSGATVADTSEPDDSGSTFEKRVQPGSQEADAEDHDTNETASTDKADTADDEPPSTGAADQDNALQTNAIRDEWARSDLIAEVQRFAESIDEPPRKELLVAYGEYPATAYSDEFGSWNTVLEAAGLDPGDQPDWSKRSCTNKEVLDGIRECAEELGRPPTTTEMQNHGSVSAGLGTSRFQSWDTALEMAGLDPSATRAGQSQTAKKYTKEDVREAIQEVADELGRPPTTNEFSDRAPMSFATASNRFGSWNAALEAAGLDPVNRPATNAATGADPDEPAASSEDNREQNQNGQTGSEEDDGESDLDAFIDEALKSTLEEHKSKIDDV